MKPLENREFLKALGCKVPQSQPRSGWTICNCPRGPWKHTNGKSAPEVFGVSNDPGDSRTSCFSCDWHGTMQELLIDLHHLNKMDHHLDVKWGDLFDMVSKADASVDMDLSGPTYEEMLSTPKDALHPFPEWWLQGFLPVSDCPGSWDYLNERDVSPDMASRLDLRFDTVQKRVCFPVRDFSGMLMGLHGRALDPEAKPRYRAYLQAGRMNPIIWLGESWVDVNKPILVVEGPFDLARARQVYANTVSPLYATPGNLTLSRMGDALEWVTLLDVGQAGDQGRAKITSTMGKGRIITHLRTPTGVKDPGEMTEQQLRDLLAPHLPLQK